MVRQIGVRGLAAVLGLALALAAPAARSASEQETALVAELNEVRAHPQDYARRLRREAEAGDPTAEGARFAIEDRPAYEEAVAFLMRQSPLPPLRYDPRLAAAAHDQAEIQARSGETGHAGLNGETLGAKLHRHNVWAGLSGEDISYGYGDPHAVVRQLVIDSGVATRGHRDNIFNPAFQFAGASCGAHRRYRVMCVIDFAGLLVER